MKQRYPFMKPIPFVLVVITILALMQGCKKKEFDPSAKSAPDFLGTWTGELTTFKDNVLSKERGIVMIYPEEGGSTLSGIIYLKEIRAFKQFQFQGGTLYFKVVNNNPDNPLCKTWNLSGYASFSDESTLDFRITGNECGYIGNEYVEWAGSLRLSPETQDSLEYFSFTQPSNNWTYKVEKVTGDTCQLQKLLATQTGFYLFNGESTHTCGWPATNIPLKWMVNPAEFTVFNDATLVRHELTIPVWALPGVIYTRRTTTDTITLTLLDKENSVVTDAGTFLCNRYRYSETIAHDGIRTTRTSYLWVDYRNGIIRHEVVNPTDTTGIISEVLKSKFPVKQ